MKPTFPVFTCSMGVREKQKKAHAISSYMRHIPVSCCPFENLQKSKKSYDNLTALPVDEFACTLLQIRGNFLHKRLIKHGRAKVHEDLPRHQAYSKVAPTISKTHSTSSTCGSTTPKQKHTNGCETSHLRLKRQGSTPGCAWSDTKTINSVNTLETE